ncbi:hypothetical protein L1987_69689 [Smallanthus sonchifolius]|uniref:Uncharacterized protein n=1 Tax=Smallanthus sonchifolius TaxID=185202 RepID=A0ACB9B7N9_9ASTR|nr:hypothetical protein L1987_69689 [Smallanthus sonchifolius]
MDDFLVALVDDINAWNRYPLGTYIWDLIYPHLHSCFEWKKKYVEEHNLQWMNYSLPGFAWAFKKNFRSVGINPNELEVDEEWWIESVAFIEQQQKECLRQSVRGKGIPIKRKWSSEEEETTQSPNDHDEEEPKEYRNENIVCKTFGFSFYNIWLLFLIFLPLHDDFDVKAANTPGPSVVVMERPKRTNVLSPYIVYKKKQGKKNDVFDVKKVREFYASLQASPKRENPKPPFLFLLPPMTFFLSLPKPSSSLLSRVSIVVSLHKDFSVLKSQSFDFEFVPSIEVLNWFLLGC